MRAKKLMLRCYAECDGGLWMAFCLDFSLGCQGDSFEEVRAKLDAQIREYVYDAMAGEDKEHAGILLTRRAPLSYWLKYWYAGFRMWLAKETHARRPMASQQFREPIPLVPASC